MLIKWNLTTKQNVDWMECPIWFEEFTEWRKIYMLNWGHIYWLEWLKRLTNIAWRSWYIIWVICKFKQCFDSINSIEQEIVRLRSCVEVKETPAQSISNEEVKGADTEIEK